MSCRAVQVNDQMQCGRCGLQWDVRDPEPPKCIDDRVPVVTLHGDRARYVDFIRQTYNIEGVRK